ncbi:MAG: hypothetical protein FWH07_04130 [Oscillospiraceae bacterium]|nr:hypothetical protein [Oscillospiraceae bacterium]
MKTYDIKDALSSFAKSFLTNLKTIIFAFIVSVIIWLAISFQFFPNVDSTFDVPVSAELTAYMRDVKLELSEAFNETIEVTVSGKRYEIASLGEADFYAAFDFTDVREAGDYDVRVIVRAREEENAGFLTPGREITKAVKIIQIAEKTLRTDSDAQYIEAIEGMTIDYTRVTVSPESVLISGEKSLIDSIHGVRVSAVSGELLSATSTLQGEPIFFDSRGVQISPQIIGEGITIEERAFTVTVPVFKRKTLPLKVSINAPDNFDLDSLHERMRIEPEELTIASPDASIDNYDAWDIGTVSLSEITFGNLEAGLSIPISMLGGYENVSGNNVARLVFDDIEDYGVRMFEVPSSNINNINVPAGYSVKHITRMIPVRVVGPSNIIHSMTVADITGTITFAGITDISAGERLIGVTFTIAGSNVSAWVIDEYKVDIEISDR